MLKESQYSIQEPYYTLMDAINKFEEAFENDYDTTDGANNEVIASLEAARKKIDDFVRHPEGNGRQQWCPGRGFHGGAGAFRSAFRVLRGQEKDQALHVLLHCRKTDHRRQDQ